MAEITEPGVLDRVFTLGRLHNKTECDYAEIFATGRTDETGGLKIGFTRNYTSINEKHEGETGFKLMAPIIRPDVIPSECLKIVISKSLFNMVIENFVL